MPDMLELLTYDIDRPSITDIAKLKLLAAEIQEVSCRTPERIVNPEAQAVASNAEIQLNRLAQEVAAAANDLSKPLPNVAEVISISHRPQAA